ncbi:MAG: dTDP-4-amino-4,6-dideoxygalactose transaminase [Deltaproteobacteria bacterium]|nr:dTDP-4-amino-4,6-dideoxygalactose transaminase [Deltaproteobacteria bacterium]
MRYRITFNRPFLSGHELENIQKAFDLGHSAGDGAFTHKCHEWFEKRLGVKKALLTTSCTSALEMAAILLNVQEGDEVIVPSFTFVSTVNAFVLRGATPVFVDVRPDTLNIDEKLIEGRITRRTKAIVPVHYAGVGCEMDAITRLAEDKRIVVVEDNAHGLLGKFKGRFLGTWGEMATQSFHETKNVICGEGGALLLNDSQFIDRAEIIREKGTNRKRFFRGQVDKYSWVDIGSSFLPSDILAAFLLSQLESIERIQGLRKRLWNRYSEELSSWAETTGATLPQIPKHCEQSYHMFYVLMPSPDARAGMIESLKARGIQAVFHYLPLHLSEMGKRWGGKVGDCPVTEQVSDCVVRLPFFNAMTESEQGEVIDAVKGYGRMAKAA